MRRGRHGRRRVSKRKSHKIFRKGARIHKRNRPSLNTRGGRKI